MEENIDFSEISRIISNILGTKVEINGKKELERLNYKLSPDAVKEIAFPVIEYLSKVNKEFCVKYWRIINVEAQGELILDVLNYFKDDREMFSKIWDKTYVGTQDGVKDEVLEKYGENPKFLFEIFIGGSNAIKIENIDKIPQLVETARESEDSYSELLTLWRSLNFDNGKYQLENINLYEELLDSAKNSKNNRLIKLWSNTCSEINESHQEIHEQVVEQLREQVGEEKFLGILSASWFFTDLNSDIQRKYLPMILDNISDSFFISDLIGSIKEDVLIENIDKILEIAPYDGIAPILGKLPENIIKNNINLILEKMKNSGFITKENWRKLPEQYKTFENLAFLSGKNCAIFRNLFECMSQEFINQNFEQLLDYVKELENASLALKENITTEIIFSLPSEIQSKNKDKLASYDFRIKGNKKIAGLPDDFFEIVVNNEEKFPFNRYTISLDSYLPQVMDKVLRTALPAINSPDELKRILGVLEYEYNEINFNQSNEALTSLNSLFDSLFDTDEGKPPKEFMANIDRWLNLCYEKAKTDPEFIKMFMRSVSKDVQERVNSTFENNVKFLYPNLEEGKYKTIEGRYNLIKQYNKDINDTINFEFLNSNLFEIFEVDQLGRITSDEDLQVKLMEYNNNPLMIDLIKNIAKTNENWIMTLDRVVQNLPKYQDILNIEEFPEINLDEYSKNLISVLVGRENYFDVRTPEDVMNFQNIKKDICLKILRGDYSNKELQAIMHEDSEISLEEARKFAYLELMYGIDIKDAKNLVMKYGKDIDDVISKQDNGKPTYADILKQFEEILERKDFSQIYEYNEEELSNIQNTIDFPVISEFESKLINLYEKSYKEVLYSVGNGKDEKLANENYDGKEVEVYELNPKAEFSMFARVEGAYIAWKEPENFADAINIPSTKYHGNCKSYVANNMLGIARPKGPIWGYSEVSDNSMLLAAPWDIVSSGANRQFSTSSVEWDYKSGIEYRSPKEMINSTRHGHNEFVSDRLLFDSETMTYKKDKPQYVIYLKESSDEDYKSTDMWRMSKKAANQLGIPIVIIDKEAVVASEFQKFEMLKEIFLGKRENDTGLVEEQILEKMIVEFENNKAGVEFSKSLKEKYFSNSQREEMINQVNDKIKALKNSDFERYEKLNAKFLLVMENEISKQFSSTGKVTGTQQNIDFYNKYLSYCKLGDVTEKLNENLQPEVLKCIKAISATNFYDGNIQHSIEHIQKVILFSGILAQSEDLSEEQTKLLLIAAAFHDSGRSGIDGKSKHAEASAMQIQKYLEENPDNPFGITKENLGILQVAIHYHEYNEPNVGKLDEKYLKKLCEKYNVKAEEFENVKKISELLKDADALDRNRFLKRGRLQTQYLHSDFAKNKNIVNYSNKLNNEIMIKRTLNVLVNYYGVNLSEITADNMLELLENQRKRRVEIGLEEKRDIEESFDGVSKITKKEPSLSLEELLKIYGLDKVKEPVDNSKLDVLKNTYLKSKTTLSGVTEIGKALVNDLDLARDGKKEKSLE